MKKIFNIGIILVVLLSMSGISSAAYMIADPSGPKIVQPGDIGQWDIDVTLEVAAEQGKSITMTFDTNNPKLKGKLIYGALTSGVPATTGSLTLTTPSGSLPETFTVLYEVTPDMDTSLIDHSMWIDSDITSPSVPSVSVYVTTPEFPTIALPIAAILGLAFIFQRRREEE